MRTYTSLNRLLDSLMKGHVPMNKQPRHEHRWMTYDAYVVDHASMSTVMSARCECGAHAELHYGSGSPDAWKTEIVEPTPREK
jgi:hypothetical protein